MRRLGDIIQALAVMAIVGLSVSVIDLRITIVKNQDMIQSQEILHTQQMRSMKENLEMQVRVLDSLVQRMTLGVYTAEQGRALENRVNDLSDRIESQDNNIRNLYQITVSEIKENTRTAK